MKTKFTLKIYTLLILLSTVLTLKVNSQTWTLIDTVFNSNSITTNKYDFSANGTYGVVSCGWGYRFTSDAGLTWSPYTDPTPYYALFSCYKFNGNQTTVYAGSDQGRYELSTDGGATWVGGPPLFAYTCNINDIRFSGTNGIIVTNEGEVAYTTDNANTWTTLPTRPHGDLSSINHLEMPSSNIAYMAGNNLFMKSLDGGQTWANVTGGLPSGGINSLSFSSDLNGCVVVYPTAGPPTQLWKTIDGGNSWTQISTSPTAPIDVYSVNGNLIYTTADNKIYKSTDGGLTWTVDYTLTGATTGQVISGIKFCGNTGYAICGVSGGSKVVRNVNALSTVAENNLQEQIKIFPVPATTQITIQTEQLTKSDCVSIINIQGQEVLKQQIINLQTTIDINNLSSGIYFVKYENENGTAIQKLIKQ